MAPGEATLHFLLIAGRETAASFIERAERSNLRLLAVTTADELAAHATGGSKLPVQLAGKFTAFDQALMDGLTNLLPDVILYEPLPVEREWDQRLRWIKALPETRRLPLVLLTGEPDGSPGWDTHAAELCEAHTIEQALEDLRGLHERCAAPSNQPALHALCNQALASSAEAGVRLFNAGRYFEAHERLEQAWMEDSGPGRNLYRAMLQGAVAYYQIERGNYWGAVKMFLRVRQWIRPLPDICRHVDVAALREQLEGGYLELSRLGPDRVAAFDRRLFASLRLVD